MFKTEKVTKYIQYKNSDCPANKYVRLEVDDPIIPHIEYKPGLTIEPFPITWPGDDEIYFPQYYVTATEIEYPKWMFWKPTYSIDIRYTDI